MSLQRLLDKYKQELNYFFNHLMVEEIEKVFTLLKQCQGILFISGVGKSALVAQKIAVTLTATGTRAFFISPLEAMHGDIGLVTSNDLFLAISKSGETDEILNLLPYVRNKGAKVIAFVSNPKSRLAKGADLYINFPIESELCPFNMAPTVSTTAQTILGDVLAIACMEARKFTLNEYAMNHPAGTIGKRITVRVRDLMLKDRQLPLCEYQDRVVDTLLELSDKRAGCVLVVDQNKILQGIFTDGDLRRALQNHGSATLDRPVGEVMTQGGRSVGPDILAWDAMKEMEGNQKSPITVLPVVDQEKRVLGLLKMHDILQSGI